MYTCRACERPINPATELCPYCGTDLTEPEAPRTEVPEERPSLISVLARWGVLLAAMWVFLWFVLPERRGDVAGQAEARAMEMLSQAQTALLAYAEAQGGSFPPSLDVLPQDSSAAVRQAAQSALGQGYELFYAPGPTTPDGRVRSFALQARAGHHGYRNFFLDETGMLRATRENRPATAEDPPI